MPLTLEEYVERLDERTDLPWPAAPKIDPPRAKPSIERLPVKCVFWTVYGTLVAIPQGELQFEHPQEFVTDAALDKVIKEFKMWNSMSRKPGAPAAYLKEQYRKALTGPEDGRQRRREIPGGAGRAHLGRHREEAAAEGVHLRRRDVRLARRVREEGRVLLSREHPGRRGLSRRGRCAAHGGRARGRPGPLADGQCFTPGSLQRCCGGRIRASTWTR